MWRSLLFIIIFCGTAWAFWQNSQSHVHRLAGVQNVWDDPPRLSEKERDALQEMIGQFKARYNIDVRMEILDVPLHAPAGKYPLIYIGINPQSNDFLLSYPGWLRLEEDFAAKVNAAHVQPQLLNGQYAYALADALRAVWDALQAETAGPGRE